MAADMTQTLPRPRLAVARTPHLDQATAAEWDAVAGGTHFYVSSGWLRFVASDVAARTTYLLARDGQRVLGALPLYDVLADNNPGYQIERYRSIFEIAGTALLAGSLRGYRGDLLVDRELGRSDANAVAETLIAGSIEEARRRHAVGVV